MGIVLLDLISCIFFNYSVVYHLLVSTYKQSRPTGTADEGRHSDKTKLHRSAVEF